MQYNQQIEWINKTMQTQLRNTLRHINSSHLTKYQSPSAPRLYNRITNNIRVLNKSRLSTNSNHSIGSVALRRTELSNDKIYSREEQSDNTNQQSTNTDLNQKMRYSSRHFNNQSKDYQLKIQNNNSQRTKLSRQSDSRSLNKQRNSLRRPKGMVKKLDRKEIYQKLFMMEDNNDMNGDQSSWLLKQQRRHHYQKQRGCDCLVINQSRKERKGREVDKLSIGHHHKYSDSKQTALQLQSYSNRANIVNMNRIKSQKTIKPSTQQSGIKISSKYQPNIKISSTQQSDIKISLKNTHCKELSRLSVNTNHLVDLNKKYQCKNQIKQSKNSHRSSRNKYDIRSNSNQNNIRKKQDKRSNNHNHNQQDLRGNRNKQDITNKINGKNSNKRNDDNEQEDIYQLQSRPKVSAKERIKQHNQKYYNIHYCYSDRQDNDNQQPKHHTKRRQFQTQNKHCVSQKYLQIKKQQQHSQEQQLLKNCQKQITPKKTNKLNHNQNTNKTNHNQNTNKLNINQNINNTNKLNNNDYSINIRNQQYYRHQQKELRKNISIRANQFAYLYGDQSNSLSHKYTNSIIDKYNNRRSSKHLSNPILLSRMHSPSSSRALNNGCKQNEYFDRIVLAHSITSDTNNQSSQKRAPTAEISSTIDSLILSVNSHISSSQNQQHPLLNSINKLNLHLQTLQLIRDYSQQFKKMYEDIEQWQELIFLSYKKYWIERVKVIDYLKKISSSAKTNSNNKINLRISPTNTKKQVLSSPILEDPFKNHNLLQNPFKIPFCRLSEEEVSRICRSSVFGKTLQRIEQETCAVYSQLQQLYNQFIAKCDNPNLNMIECDNFSEEVYLQMLTEIERLLPNLEELKLYEVTKIRLGKIVKVGILLSHLNGNYVRNISQILMFDDCETNGNKKKIKAFTVFDLYYETFQQLVLQ